MPAPPWRPLGQRRQPRRPAPRASVVGASLLVASGFGSSGRSLAPLRCSSLLVRQGPCTGIDLAVRDSAPSYLLAPRDTGRPQSFPASRKVHTGSVDPAPNGASAASLVRGSAERPQTPSRRSTS